VGTLGFNDGAAAAAAAGVAVAEYGAAQGQQHLMYCCSVVRFTCFMRSSLIAGCGGGVDHMLAHAVRAALAGHEAGNASAH
jgi:hypothetical protein